MTAYSVDLDQLDRVIERMGTFDTALDEHMKKLNARVDRLHTTWTVTKLDVAPPKDTDFTIPSKGKKVTEQGLYETIKLSFKDWGKMASSNVWWALL